GHVHLIVWDYGPSVPYLPNFRRARTPLRSRRDLTAGPLEGFPAGDAYAVRTVTMGGEMLELVADLGPKPFASARLRSVNAVLRATSSDVHVDLLELPGGEGARYARLPVALTP